MNTSRRYRASYSYTIEDGVVCIIDNDQGKSVTNDAENVIADLVAEGVDLTKNLVVYRDTTWTWDQLLVDGNQFSGFKSINATDKESAKAKVRGRL